MKMTKNVFFMISLTVWFTTKTGNAIAEGHAIPGKSIRVNLVRAMDEGSIDQNPTQRQLSDIFASSPVPVPISVPASPSLGTPTQLASGKSPIEVMLTQDYRGGFIFYNESSYSMKALRFVEETSEGMEQWRIAQRYALACIYFATNRVPTRYTDTFFGSNGALLGWQRKWANDADNENECLWPGVVCRDDSADMNGDSYGPVLELNLASHFMTGTLPIEVTILKDTLQVLDLENNFVFNNGPANVWWIGELTHLQVLNLGKTAFSDGNDQGIPTHWRNLVHLRELSLDATLFFGSIDETIFAGMSHLEYLDLGGLAFHGPLPRTFKTLPNLKYLYVDNTNVVGDLAMFLDGTGFPKLVEFWADNNPGIGGTIPTTIGNISSLRSLSLSNCGLTGPIPSELGKLTHLKQIWLHDNRLTEAIPAELGQIAELERLYLQQNDLSGIMPPAICLNRFGYLQTLGADCTGNNDPSTTSAHTTGNVTCSVPACCTCCGSSCTV